MTVVILQIAAAQKSHSAQRITHYAAHRLEAVSKLLRSLNFETASKMRTRWSPIQRRRVRNSRHSSRHSQRIVAFTGAGISTESGIPDFRSPGGIWSRMQPIDFRDFMRSADMRREAWRRKAVIDRDFQQATPNRGHRALATLVARGVMSAIITQNIDGLHQASGVPSEQVIELHGNGTYASCLDCGLRYELAPIMAAFEHDESLPVCTVCGGIIKSATISFGQSMPQAAMARAHAESTACDLFIVLGFVTGGLSRRRFSGAGQTTRRKTCDHQSRSDRAG